MRMTALLRYCFHDVFAVPTVVEDDDDDSVVGAASVARTTRRPTISAFFAKDGDADRAAVGGGVATEKPKWCLLQQS